MGDEKEKERFFVKEEFIEWWAESFAEAIKRHSAKIEWLERRDIKLDEARHALPVNMIPPEGFETGNYIRVLYLDGTASLRLDTLGDHEFDLTVFLEKKLLFHDVYVSNDAQPGKKLVLSLGRGDFSIPESAQMVTPLDLQAQLRSVVAHTITPLGANQPYESGWFDALNYSRITLLAFADQASASDGVVIQQSTDGENVDSEEDAWTLTPPAPARGSVELYGRYVRVRYTNGATPQNTFRLMALARVI